MNKGELARARKAAKKAKGKAKPAAEGLDDPAAEGAEPANDLQSARDDLEWARLSGDEAAIKQAKKVLIGVRKKLRLPSQSAISKKKQA
jgi:hypothetical protein